MGNLAATLWGSESNSASMGSIGTTVEGFQAVTQLPQNSMASDRPFIANSVRGSHGAGCQFRYPRKFASGQQLSITPQKLPKADTCRAAGPAHLNSLCFLL